MFGTASFFGSRQFQLVGIFILALAACQGGKTKYEECFYDTVTTTAEVINMQPHLDGDGRISVILDFKASILALEDQELGELKDIKIDHDFLVRNSIEVDNRYEVVVSELTKGNCDTKLTVAFSHSFE